MDGCLGMDGSWSGRMMEQSGKKFSVLYNVPAKCGRDHGKGRKRRDSETSGDLGLLIH